MIEIFKDKKFTEKLNKDLKNGAVICFVTDTVWGIGCLPTSKEGVEKIYNIKERDRNKPLILMSNNIANLRPYVKLLSENAENLVKKYFPGALTLVVEKSNLTKDYITSNKNTVGIRVPNNTFFQSLCENIEGGVLATTSANPSDFPSAKNYKEAVFYLKNKVDYIFKDYDYNCKGLESTVAFVSDNDIKILRQGAVTIL